MKKKEERNEKQMSEIQAENKRLKEPLEKAKAEVAELKKQLANYQKDKQSLQVSFWNISRYLKPSNFYIFLKHDTLQVLSFEIGANILFKNL